MRGEHRARRRRRAASGAGRQPRRVGRLGADGRERRAEASDRCADRHGHSVHLRPRAQHGLSGARAGLGGGLGAADLFIGVNALDYSGYPDCRPEFIAAFERLANLATKAGVEGSSRFRVHTPLIALSKAQIIRTGLDLGVDFSLTSSCYDPQPGGRPCGACDSCALRRKGFAELGLTDPLDKK